MEGKDLPQGNKDNLDLIGVDGNGNAKKITTDTFDQSAYGDAVLLFDRGAGSPLPMNTFADIPANLQDKYKSYVITTGYVSHPTTGWNYNRCYIFNAKVLQHQEQYQAGGNTGKGFYIQAHYSHSGKFAPVFVDEKMTKFKVGGSNTSIRQVWGIK